MTLKIVEKIVVLGTGGTIAGVASRPSDNLAYAAAQVPVADLLQDV
jgi:L-asparaginase